MPDYDMVVIGSGYAGSTAALSFLEATGKDGQVGRVALIEAGKKGTWPGGSRWSRPFLWLDSDNKLMRDRAHREEQDQSGYWRKFEDEVPDTVEFMKDHRVKLIHHDEENAALDFEEQHFAYPGVGGGKEIIDDYLIRIAKFETADVLYGHEATGLTLDDEGRIGGVVVQEPDGEQRTITAGSVVLACGGFEGDPEMLSEHLGKDAGDLPIIVPGIKYNRGAGIRMAMDIGADTAGRFDMFHAELVDPRAKTPHSVIWGQNYGIVVNENCERFHDEGEDYLFASTESIAYDTWRNQNQKSYLITDKTVMDRFQGSWVYETAALPPEQSDTGGLKVDPDGRVLNTNDAPIPGLYAAGEITGYHEQPPQTSVLRASTFGRIIGTNIAELLPETASATG